MKIEMETKFDLGQIVAMKASVELHGLAAVQPLTVSYIAIELCHGGRQVSYLVRAFTFGGKSTWGNQVTSLFTAPQSNGLLRVDEPELVPLDIDAYKAAVNSVD